MKHLTDEQLCARLDRELPPNHAGAAERHLAGCEDCRERLAALAGSDVALSRALDHDPGDAYFASFADRVQARIAGSAPGSALSAGSPARGWFGWLSNPGTLAWAGAAAALVVVGAFAIQFASHNGSGGVPAPEHRSILGAGRRERAPESAPPEPAATAAPKTQASNEAPLAAPPPAEKRSVPARDAAPAPAPQVAPQRVQELRTLPNGEQVPVQTQRMPQSDSQKMFAAQPSGGSAIPKPSAMPLAAAPAPATRRTMAPTSAPAGGTADLKLAPPAAAPAPLAVQTSETEGAALRADQDGNFKLCGRVTDTAGRSLANATVVVVETGGTVSTGSDGRFCLDAPAAHATISVMSVGYLEHRAVLRAEDTTGELAVALAPVSPLGSPGLPAARFKVPSPPPAPAGQGQVTAREERALAQASKLSANGAVPTIAALPGESAEARTAREASEAALRLRTAKAWSKAGALWDGVAVGAGADAAGNEARYRAAEARMNVWRLAGSSANLRAAYDAVDACLARAPQGEQRTRVEAWRKELPQR